MRPARPLANEQVERLIEMPFMALELTSVGSAGAARRSRRAAAVPEGARDEMHCAILWRRPGPTALHCVFSWPGSGRRSIGSAKLNKSLTSTRSRRAFLPEIVRSNAIDCVRAWPRAGRERSALRLRLALAARSSIRRVPSGGGGRNAPGSEADTTAETSPVEPAARRAPFAPAPSRSSEAQPTLSTLIGRRPSLERRKG